MFFVFFNGRETEYCIYKPEGPPFLPSIGSVNKKANRKPGRELTRKRKKRKEKRKERSKMPCAMVVPNSPIFSSTSRIPPMFCKSSSSSPCSSPRSPLPASSSSSPKSPLSLRAQRQGVGSGIASGLGWGSTAVKRKRPARIDIPVQTWSLAVETPRGEKTVEVGEEDGDGYSVYCKRGRRGPMEDRFCAVVDGAGDDKQVNSS